MVVNNSDPEQGGGGGKEGVLAIVAIAVVLFFVIRIYADYVTATGQAVKPGSKRQAAAHSAPQKPSAEEEPLDRPSPRRAAERTEPEIKPKPRNAPPIPSSDEIYANDAPKIVRPRLSPTDTWQDVVPVSPRRAGTQGQVVIERDPDETDIVAPSRTTVRRSASGGPPSPQPIDESEPLSPPVNHRSTHVNADLFEPSNPYPGSFDDIQVGDRLSDISGMELPRGGRSRSVYTYHPKSGLFKTIYAMLTVGDPDPKVTGVVYLFRDAKHHANVRRQAMTAFGEGDSVLTDRGERTQWPHMNGVTVAIEPDRYMVEKDLSAEGRRRARRRKAAESD